MDTFDLDDELPALTPAPPPSRRRWLALALVVLLAVGGLGLLEFDQRDRAREFDALLLRVEQGQSASLYADRQVLAMVDYTSPMVFSQAQPERVRAGLRAIVQQAADKQVAPLLARRRAVAGLTMAGWHSDQRHARDIYLRYLDLRITYMREISQHLSTLFEPQPEEPKLLAAVRASLFAASPDEPAKARVIAALTPDATG